MAKPQVTHLGVFNMQVCVSREWSDSQVLKFAEEEYPCGTTAGWQIRRGMLERVTCANDPGNVHIILDA